MHNTQGQKYTRHQDPKKNATRMQLKPDTREAKPHTRLWGKQTQPQTKLKF